MLRTSVAGSISRLFRALTAHASASAEAVVVGNLLSAAALGAVAWLYGGLSFRYAGVLAVLSFILLTVCIVNRYTFWISLLLGGTTFSVFPALMSAGVGLHIGGEIGAWIGGVLGFVLGVAVAISSYSEIAQAVLQKRRKDHDAHS